MSNFASYRGLEEVDWDLTYRIRRSGWRTWHWYPGRMHEAIAAILIGVLSRPAETILDPFCGSGTVLTSANVLGRSAIGVDLNPVATEISAAKLVNVDVREIDRFRRSVDRCRPILLGQEETALGRTALIPNRSRQESWYHPQTLEELARIFELVEAIDDKELATVARACFSAVLVPSSSQDKHWGWICDNVKPERLQYRDALVAYLAKLDMYAACRAEMMRDQRWMSHGPTEWEVLTGDSIQVMAGLPADYVDLIVTSPPYFGANDYIASQRLSLLWDEERYIRERGDARDVDYRTWRNQEIGARFKRYGRDGRAEYLADMAQAIHEFARIVRPGGHVCLVLGESSARDPVVEQVLRGIRRAGFTLRFRVERNIPTQRQLSPRIKSEQVIVLQAA